MEFPQHFRLMLGLEAGLDGRSRSLLWLTEASAAALACLRETVRGIARHAIASSVQVLGTAHPAGLERGAWLCNACGRPQTRSAARLGARSWVRAVAERVA
nr:hypothetical protein [Xanthomonas fragariae]